MVKKRLKPFALPTIYLTLTLLFALMTFFINKSLQVANTISQSFDTYVSYEILMDNSVPVISTDEKKIIKPYLDETVKVVRKYYDSDTYKEEDNSIFYFENTYLQNKGIDYAANGVFNVISILDGTVISITEDDILGKTVKIKHDNDFISVYQSMSELMIQENDTVNKGQVIGQSGTNVMGSDLGNHLHFELFHKNMLVNPDEYYDKTVGDF